jgi:hypothetical protein
MSAYGKLLAFDIQCMKFRSGGSGSYSMRVITCNDTQYLHAATECSVGWFKKTLIVVLVLAGLRYNEPNIEILKFLNGFYILLFNCQCDSSVHYT